jgi:hypothetical protein
MLSRDTDVPEQGRGFGSVAIGALNSEIMNLGFDARGKDDSHRLSGISTQARPPIAIDESFVHTNTQRHNFLSNSNRFGGLDLNLRKCW